MAKFPLYEDVNKEQTFAGFFPSPIVLIVLQWFIVSSLCIYLF